MSGLNNTQKAVEVKVRSMQGPRQPREDQKDMARVFVSSDVLLDLHMKSEQPCYLWKAGEEPAQRRQALIWLSPNKIHRDVMQMWNPFRDVCGFKLEDRIFISPSEPVSEVDTVILRETKEKRDIEDLEQAVLPHWEYVLHDKLERASTIFTGMKFEISLVGARRAFVVDSLVRKGHHLQTTLAQLSSEAFAKISYSAAAVAEQTMVNGVRPPLQVVGLAGIDRAISKLNDFLARFDRPDDCFRHKGFRSCGVLVHGSRGTGKSLVLDRISQTGWGKSFRVETDSKPQDIREIFKNAREAQPSIIVVDDLDSLVSKDSVRSHDISRIFGEELDHLALNDDDKTTKVVVAASTSSPSDIPSSLKKRGRFTTEIPLAIPDADSRKKILKSLAPTGISPAEITLLEAVGERTHAYTPEDLCLLYDEACRISEKRIYEAQIKGSSVDHALSQADIDQASLSVRPTAMRDVTLRPPKVYWNEIGGQDTVKKTLRRAVEAPLSHPDLFIRLGASAKKGILLYGPPGCSKTLSAQAMATETGFNFFAVKGAELLNMYVGESERAVREVFSRARAASPSIIFFDEIESIGGRREGGGRHSGVHVLTTLLNEMDGIEILTGVTVLAATNKPEDLDLALLRPGRFDDLVYVSPPDEKGIEEILRFRQKTMDFANDVDISKLAQEMTGYSGAEVVAICQKACDQVIDKSLDTNNMGLQIHMKDFSLAMKEVKRQITPALVDSYRSWASGIRNDR